MVRRVVLHVGLMKSGTSYLQQRLFLNRAVLADRGVLVPGNAWRDQTLAVQDALGRRTDSRREPGKWNRLLTQVAGHEGDAVISVELLGPVAPERIGGIIDAFGDVPIDVVVTVRDLGRVVPAMWQERLKNGGTAGWRDYLEGLAAGRETARGFWWQQGAARIVGNWAGAVGPERVTVVTVPLPGAEPGLLWSRFCTAAALPGDGCADVAPTNASLDVESAAVLRALNTVLAERGGIDPDYQLMLKFRLAKQVMAARTGGRPIGFEPPSWLTRRADEMVAKIRATGVSVVGDLSDLTPLAVAGDDPDAVEDADALAAAVDALCGLTADFHARRVAPRSGVAGAGSRIRRRRTDPLH